MLLPLVLCLTTSALAVLAIWLWPQAADADAAAERQRQRATEAQGRIAQPPAGPAPPLPVVPVPSEPEPPQMPAWELRLVAAFAAAVYPTIVLLNTSLIAYSLLALLPAGTPLFVIVIGSYERAVTLHDVLATCLVFALIVGGALIGVRDDADGQPAARPEPGEGWLPRWWASGAGRLSALGRTGLYLALGSGLLQAAVAFARGLKLSGLANGGYSACAAALLAALDAVVGYLVIHNLLRPLFESWTWKRRVRQYQKALRQQEAAAAAAAARLGKPEETRVVSGLRQRLLLVLYRFPLSPLQKLDAFVYKVWIAGFGQRGPGRSAVAQAASASTRAERPIAAD